jgi:hypothetical protein
VRHWQPPAGRVIPSEVRRDESAESGVVKGEGLTGTDTAADADADGVEGAWVWCGGHRTEDGVDRGLIGEQYGAAEAKGGRFVPIVGIPAPSWGHIDVCTHVAMLARGRASVLVGGRA